MKIYENTLSKLHEAQYIIAHFQLCNSSIFPVGLDFL